MAQIVADGEIVEESETEEVIEQEEVGSEESEETDETTAESLADEEERKFWDDKDDEELADVPVSTHIRVKQKLKGQLTARDKELDQLKQKIADLEKARESVPVLKRPKENDFDTDEAYETAKDKYDDDLAAQRYDRIEREKKQTAVAKQSLESVSAAVDDHYKRADDFVAKFEIKPERYQQADLSLKKAVDAVMPGRGEVVMNQIISVLGKESEKVLFHVGAKTEKLHKFQSLFLEDQTGFKALVYLGEQKGILTNPKKRTSRAPKPTMQLKGDGIAGSNGKALKKEYDKGHKPGGDRQKAFNAKKAARAAGVDTSTW